MRIVASACLVLAILFMVGCGTSAEDKKMIQDHGTQLQALKTSTDGITKMAGDMTKKIADIETYLKSKDPKYGVPPDTMKKVDVTKKGAEPAKKEEPKKEEPKKGTKPAATKGPGTGK